MESQVQKRTDRMKTLNILSPRSSENIDYSARPDSMESSDSNVSGLQSPSQSSISSGNIPYTVNDPSIPKATGKKICILLLVEE